MRKPKILIGGLAFIAVFGLAGSLVAINSQHSSDYDYSDSSDTESDSEFVQEELDSEELSLQQQQQVQAEAIAEQQRLDKEREWQEYSERTALTYQRFGDVIVPYAEFLNANNLEVESSLEAERLSDYHRREIQSINTDGIDPKLASAINVFKDYADSYHAILVDYNKALASVDRSQELDALQGCGDGIADSETLLGAMFKCTVGGLAYGAGSATVEGVNNGLQQYQIEERIQEMDNSYGAVFAELEGLPQHMETEYGITRQN
ncbi:MAG: hypothetical protein HC800_23590 [Phormidesmis sp. RL_2_1]|nr:hypothetical protein [Phormidesmis sp. RL_2_1]